MVKRKEQYCVARENYMKFKFQCSQMKIYWNIAMPIGVQSGVSARGPGWL